MGEKEQSQQNPMQQTQTPQQQAQNQPEMIQLDVDTYSALLDRLVELEKAQTSTKSSSDEDDPIDRLATEARGEVGGQRRAQRDLTGGKSVDDMSNTELANLIIDAINEQGGKRLKSLEMGLETLKVMREIDKATAKYSDFNVYEEDIRRLSIENPSLSIDKAYKLAKAEDPDRGSRMQKGDGESRTLTEKLLRLPPRQALGEKPGMAAGSTKAATSSETSIKSAAQQAWDEVVGKDKSVL